MLILFYLWAFGSRNRALKVFADGHLLPAVIPSHSQRRQNIKVALTIAAAGLLILSITGPKWGFHWEEVKRRGIDIMVALDTSKSMLSEDIKPNRLERAKLALKDMVRNLEGDRIGLIAFAGKSFIQCPLTLDYSAFSLSVDNINTGIIPRGGTAISRAILMAMDAFKAKERKHKALVLITDGEDHEGDPVKAAQEAAKQGIKIFCIGVGTKEGELIPVKDESGGVSFLKDRQGRVVKSRLDEVALQKVALTTAGSYLRSSGTEFGVDLIYKEKISKMEKKELRSKLQKRYEERYQIPLTLVLVLMCLEMVLGERRKR